MDYEDIYEILKRIENARILVRRGNIEEAERVLFNLEKDLRGVIFPNNPLELLEEVKG